MNVEEVVIGVIGFILSLVLAFFFESWFFGRNIFENKDFNVKLKKSSGGEQKKEGAIDAELTEKK